MNNFDTSSTGINIELHASYDLDISRFYFEEALFTIKEGNKELLVYCEGNYSDFEKEYTFTKAELVSAWLDLNGSGYGKPVFNSELKAWGALL